MTIAQTIAQQIGNLAFGMIGAKDLVDHGDALSFRVGSGAKCGGKRVSHIKIKLDPSDTYTVEFIRVTQRRLNKKTMTVLGGERHVLKTVSDVYADSLHDVIEEGTGFYTSFAPRRVV